MTVSFCNFFSYQGPAVCVVSLVEDKPPYRAHPHNIVGKDGERTMISQHFCHFFFA